MGRSFAFLDNILSPRRLIKLSVASLSLYSGSAAGKKLVVDTDLFSDVDDAAALLLASTLLDIELLAVNVNYGSSYSALAASAILNHYGHPKTPIGLRRPFSNESFFDDWAYELGEYASKIAYHWSGGSLPWFQLEDAWEPVELYRKVLAGEKDKSITIASIGFLENLSALLNSTGDTYSELDGYALVEKKVNELVVMGGGYPSGHEFNFWGDNPIATAHVVNTWPRTVSMTFLGTEVGEVVSTGARLSADCPAIDPVKAGYEWYVGYNTTRFSWDPLTVVYACLGPGEWFELAGEGGYNQVWPNGSNVWAEDPEITNQHYLKLKMDNVTVARELDELYLRGAKLSQKS
ncbi:nucleoside hydrolase [Zopfia rhizophila CBS 207.26]|uniref:Nucleoside hydrolase n=1 Tax=Zopfia rhizophila CBS 207.26 TaxID=1314779 RepID=A0A6A6EVV5_9PEZI|nr:nucleoside hydrolase [Zopfia rhizophila CBS 207.26]